VMVQRNQGSSLQLYNGDTGIVLENDGVFHGCFRQETPSSLFRSTVSASRTLLSPYQSINRRGRNLKRCCCWCRRLRRCQFHVSWYILR
jgi:hypothetical protein